NFLLRGATLEHERHQNLARLPQWRDRLRLELLVEFVLEEEHARQLLRHRAAAARPALAEHAANCRADGAERVDAGVRVEALILDGEDGLLHSLGNRRQRHMPT